MPTTSISRCGGGTTTPYATIVTGIPDLRAWWRMGDLVGNLLDSSGVAPADPLIYNAGVNHGTYHVVGATPLVALGEDDGAFDFTWNQNVANPAANAMDNFTATGAKVANFPVGANSIACFFTIHSGWTSPDPGVGTWTVVLGARSNATPSDGLAIEVNTSYQLRAYRGDGVSSLTIVHGSTLTADTWNHAAVTFDGTTTTLYLNAAVAGTSTAVVTPTAAGFVSAGNGRNTDGGVGRNRWLYGDVDESVWYARGITQAEVVSLATGV